MQVKKKRSNRERTDTTRATLLRVARELFVTNGYAGTGTPELVSGAGLTRGALYHHFADKRALFVAVVDAEARAVAREVEVAGSQKDPLKALLAGGDAYLAAMATAGRSRLLLIEAPAVLGRAEIDSLEERHGERTLREGLQAAIGAGQILSLPLDSLTRCLGAAYDRAALAISEGEDAAATREVLRALVGGLKVANG